jgi:hypothetical protein
MDMNARRDESGPDESGPDESGPDALERRARAAFDASVDALDAGARSRLHQARRQALAAAGRQPQGHRFGRSWYGAWAPAGAVAAAVLAAALLLRTPAEGPSSPVHEAASPTSAQGESLEMLAADEGYALATSEEDLAFYAWVELATAPTGAGQTG